MLYSQTFSERNSLGQNCPGDNLQIHGKNDRVTIYKYALTDYDFKPYKV